MFDKNLSTTPLDLREPNTASDYMRELDEYQQLEKGLQQEHD